MNQGREGWVALGYVPYRHPANRGSDENRQAAVGLLLAAGAGWDLEAAVLCGEVDVTGKLLSHGRLADDPHRANRLLIAAARKGHLEVIRRLLEHGGPFTSTEALDKALCAAAAEGHAGVVRLLLQQGTPPDAKPYRERDFVRAVAPTPLMAAAARGHIEIVQLLLEKGADPNRMDHSRWTARAYALGNGHQEVSELLRQAAEEQ